MFFKSWAACLLSSLFSSKQIHQFLHLINLFLPLSLFFFFKLYLMIGMSYQVKCSNLISFLISTYLKFQLRSRCFQTANQLVMEGRTQSSRKCDNGSKKSTCALAGCMILDELLTLPGVIYYLCNMGRKNDPSIL